MEAKPQPKPRTRRYEKSNNLVEINDETRAALTCNTSARLLPAVGDILQEVKNLKQQLTAVKEERDEFKEEVTFLKYQLAYRTQIQNLQKEMSEKKGEEPKPKKKTKSVRFAAKVAVNDRHASDDETDDSIDESSFDDSKEDIDSSLDIEEFKRLRTENEELHDVLHDFYHDSKMTGKNESILIGDIESHPSESISSLICRVLVSYDNLREEHRILEEEKSKLDEDKVQLTTSMTKLREQFHDAVDSNIEEIEELNHDNENLRSQVKTLSGKNTEVVSTLVKAREEYINRLKAISELSKGRNSEKLLQRLKNDSLLANVELKEAQELVEKNEESKRNKLKRVQSLPPTLRPDSAGNSERSGLLKELKTCKNLQESQRKQISKILDEKLTLETQVAELKREVVLLKAERKISIKTMSKLSQTEGVESSPTDGEKISKTVSNDDVERLTQRCKDLEQKLKQVAQGNAINANPKAPSAEMDSLTRRCKDLEQKLEKVKQEKSVLVQEKTSLLLSFDANIEKKDALEAQLADLQGKVSENGVTKVTETNAVHTQTDGSVQKVVKELSETDGGFQAGYKGISEAKVEIEKIRVQEQDKQITILKRENEAVKDKLKKAEDMSKTLQNCLKELTDEKNELVDSIEELNEEKAELEEARLKLENELGGMKREKIGTDEVSDIRNKERKIDDNLEAYKVKLAQLDMKVVEVLKLIGNEGTQNQETKSDVNKNVENMIGSLLSSVENLKVTVITFKTTYEKTKGDSLRTKNELEALNREKTELQNLSTKLRKQNEELAVSLENSKKSQKSFELKVEGLKKENARLDRELGGARSSKTGYEKSLAESRKREEGLGRQLKNISNKRDDLQKALDRQTKTSTEISSRLATATKEVEVFRNKNEKLTTEIEQLREELEATVEDRDELLELLDRIVCENGTGEEKLGLGQKVERIRERSKSEEHLPGIEVNDSGRTKPVEDVVVSSVVNNVHAATGENSLFEEKGRSEQNVKEVEVLQEENHKLKEMIEQMLKDQKKMEVVLNSLSEANAEVKQDLEESLEHTEQIRLQGSENNSVDSTVDFSTTSDENAELRRLHEAMVGTNEALSANLRRLHDEKTRSEQLKNSFQDVSSKNAVLEKDVESLSKDKERAEKDILELKKRLKELEKEAQRTKNEKSDVDSILEETNGRIKDLRLQIDSLTEINQDLRETNEKLSASSKEYQKKWSKLSDEFDEIEFQNEDLKKLKKRLEKELAERAKQKIGLEKELTEQGKQKTEIELELEKSKETIVSLRSEIQNCAEKMQEMEKSLETRERELTFLRDTAGKVTQLEQDAQAADALRSDMDDIKKTLSERDKRVAELENDVSRLKKEIQNSQRFVKAVSQENDTLRDSLSEWEREAGKIRRHVHELSQDAENHNHSDEKDPKSQETDKVRSVRAFEAMQVEMDAINQHLKSLNTENHELTTKVDALTKENAATRDRNIELLTRYDMVSKELEKKMSELNKVSKDGKDSRSKKKIDKREEEKNSLQAKIDKLDIENKLLKNTLGSTLDEEKRLAEILKNLVDGKSVRRRNSGKKDIVSEEYEIHTEISGLVTTKPDLIRDSTEVKDEYLIVEQRKYKKDLSALESSGTEADTKELLGDLLKGQMNLKSYCHEISKVVKDKASISSMDEIDGKNRSETKLTLDNITAELQKSTELNEDFEANLQEKDAELAKTSEEKAKLESELASLKEKCEKLQAVFRALILAMNDKKGGEKKSGEEAEGPTRIVDYIKGIKTKYTTLVSEKETLESKVSDLQKEIEEHKARAMTNEKRSKENKKKEDSVEDKNVSEDKERILNELLLSTARNKARLVEKLHEIFDEFSKLKSKLEKELDSQGKGSNLEIINEEFAQSVMHTERFIQSVAHDRPVTVVADSADEKDPSLELAKENEELIGRISAVQSSRRRESKNYKDELTKIDKNKMEAVKAEEAKWKEEMEKMKGELEKKMKEKEQAASEVKKSLKQEVSQLKLEIRRISDEHDVTERNARNEARSVAEKSEEKMKQLKSEMEKKLAEKDSKIVEVKQKADAEKKESAQLAEREISQVRANWADAERKLRIASEEKTDVVRELGRVRQQQNEEGTRSGRELQKLKISLEAAQKQSSEREDGFKKEKDKLQRTIANLEGQVRESEIAGLERTQSTITEFQRDLKELTKQNQQLEAAKRKTEQNLEAENERLRFENSRLQRELWEVNQQRRIGGNNDVQRRPDPNIPPGERVKVMGTVRQAPIEKSRVVTPVESVPGPFPGPPGPTTGAPGPYPGDQQRRAVKVREGQTTSVNVTRVQDQGVRRSSDPRDQVTKELGAMFKGLNEQPEWKNESNVSTVIQARPMQTRAQVQPQKQALPPKQKPQPEWQTKQDNTWPKHKDSHSSNNSRHNNPHSIRAPASSQRPGYNTAEYSRQRPGHPASKPITRQTQGSLEAEVTLSDPRRAHVVEVKNPTVNAKPHPTKSNRRRRPSIGSDDVFITNTNDVGRSLTSHGSKTGEFWRSRSLEDLLVSDDRPIRQSEQHVVHQKLPKCFSGPRKGDLGGANGGAVQGRGTGQQAAGKRVTPLKGMEFATHKFQSQI